MTDTAYVYFFIPLSDDEPEQELVTVWMDVKNEHKAWELSAIGSNADLFLADMFPMPCPNEMTLPCVMVEVTQ